MATQQLTFAGYFFGVEGPDGYVQEYPTYAMAVEGLEFRRLDGKTHKLRMRCKYETPWTPANEPEREAARD